MSGPMVPQELAIRPYAPDYRPALVEQFLGLNRYEEPFARNRRTDTQGAVESLDAVMARVASTGGHALVAELAGRVVGHLLLTFETDAVFVREDLRAHGYVAELYVRDEARNRGIARAMMAEAERLTRQRGLSRLMIGVVVGNVPAETLYARLGFLPHALTLEKRLG